MIRRRPVDATQLAWALTVAVMIVAALDTTYVEVGTPPPGVPEQFDPDSYAAETYPLVVDRITADAVDLVALLDAVTADPESAGQTYGKRDGSTGPYTYAVSGTGVAGVPDGGLLPVHVDGIPDHTTVNLQIGPALTGTALRDAAGFIEFGQFVNQVEYADAATALNDELREAVLSQLERDDLEGRTVDFIGAAQLVSTDTVTITPVELQVGA